MKPAVLTGLIALSALAAISSANTQSEHRFEWDGSRIPPVHRFPLFDENGEQIVPSYSQSLPMSSRHTCGTCHDYSVIRQGWHFNSSLGIADPGRPGEPWVWVDEATATWLPLSYRGWKGTYRPDALGISEWRFTQLFGRHMPGSDMGEPEDTLSDPHSRWDLSGKLEINCLACHNGSHEQDQSEFAKQMARENFRWAATAASGLGDVIGMATRVRDAWTIFDGPNPDDTEFAVRPAVQYNLEKFDSKGRTVFNVVHQPPDRNCLQCHSVSPAHVGHSQIDGDVHSLSGMKCADCHRNDLSHQMVRGFEGEELIEGMAHAADFSCRGCHVGAENGTMRTVQQGRLGAPTPVHAGIPPVHFEKMACTTCHSGPMPGPELTTVRTSRINRVGIHGRAEWFTDEPVIVEPVFVRNEQGVIEPRRMFWPAFFGRMVDDQVQPLTPDMVSTATEGILNAQQQVAQVLAALAATNPETTGYPVLITGGKALSRDLNGKLEAEDYEGTPTLEENWAWRVEAGVFLPLLPEVDPEGTGELGFEAEQALGRALDSLDDNPETSQPGLLYAGKLYRMELDGSIVATDHAEFKSSTTQWVRINGDSVEPLVPTETVKAALETVGTKKWATEEQISRVLKRLASAAGAQPGEFVYVSNGKLFRNNAEGVLEAVDHEAAQPVSWAIGHDVRPAAQSLGAVSCRECHDADSPYFHALVKAVGPMLTEVADATPMHLFQSRDGNYERLFGYSFQWREYFKTFLFGSAGFLALILSAYALVGMRRAARYVGTSPSSPEGRSH